MTAEKKQRKNNEGEMSFLEHLEELRWHIIRSVVAIFALMIIAFTFKNVIFDSVILAPRNPDFFTNRLLCRLGDITGIKALCINTDPANLISIKMAGQITTHITVALVAGLILAFPYVLYELWKFFRPALHNNEQQVAKGGVLVTSLLFFTGVLFGYFALAPLSIHFLTTYEVSPEVVNQINIRSYIGTITSICLATGLIFELPVITFFLTKVGLITPEFLKKYRKHAILIIVVLAAIITPPDVFSQMLVCIPLLILYEVGITISKRVIKQKEMRHKEFMEEEAS
ncbi:MAG: twin-arginine translocase subunit TatC [Bacteroidales bacterium]|nr:twin-arginine translocase subunit TatC [Bacteroidales bacterium]